MPTCSSTSSHGQAQEVLRLRHAPWLKGGSGQHGLWLVVTVPRMQQEPQTTVELVATLVFRSPTVLDSRPLIRTLSNLRIKTLIRTELSITLH